MFLRVIIHGSLLALLIFAAYLYFNRPENENYETVPARDITVNLPRPQNAGESGRGLPDEHPKLPELQMPAIPDSDHSQGETTDNRKMREAFERFNAGDYEGAAGIFRELAEKDRKAFAYLGASYFKLGDYGNAIRSLEKAVEENPDDFVSRKLLAFSYYQRDDIERSLDNAEKGLAVRDDPELRKLYERLLVEKRARQGYIGESSEHFKILFDGYEHGRVNRDITGMLEEAYRAVGRELDYFPSESLTVILYAGKDFFDITQAPEWAGGAYDGKIRIPVRGAEGNARVLRKVLFHEYAHAVVYSLTKKCPLWINEGLAEYLSSDYPQKVGQVIPLGYLENSFSWLKGENAALAYLESYSAVSYLIQRHGIYRVKEFLIALSKGDDIDRAFEGSFGTTYAGFISDWGK